MIAQMERALASSEAGLSPTSSCSVVLCPTLSLGSRIIRDFLQVHSLCRLTTHHAQFTGLQLLTVGKVRHHGTDASTQDRPMLRGVPGMAGCARRLRNLRKPSGRANFSSRKSTARKKLSGRNSEKNCVSALYTRSMLRAGGMRHARSARCCDSSKMEQHVPQIAERNAVA